MAKVTKDSKGHLHITLPGHRISRALTADMLGTVRTVARGPRTITLVRKGTADKKAKRDMKPEKFEQLKALLTQFFNEEEQEPEHKKDAACGCKH